MAGDCCDCYHSHSYNSDDKMDDRTPKDTESEGIC